MSTEAFLAALAVTWLAVPIAPIAVDRVDAWRDRRLAEIRAAERQAAAAFDRALASLRKERAL